MIRFLINSGGVYSSKDKGKRYYLDAMQGMGEKPKVLLCLFPRAREEWEQTYTRYTAGIEEVVAEEYSPTFELATPGAFEDQVERSDVVVILGGDDHLTKYWLDQYDLTKLFEGKTVTTQSASSNYVCDSYWTCDWRENFMGRGIVPVRFISHFESEYGAKDPRGPIDWNTAKKELESFGNTRLPIKALKEGEYFEYTME